MIRAAFTLIELLISTSLAMLLAAVAITAFYQVRQAAARAEANLAMCDSAKTIYIHMHTAMTAIQQSCALAAYAAERSPAGSVPETGEIKLLFMRGKEDSSDFVNMGRNESDAYVRNDLTWELWQWRRSDKTFSIAMNSRGDAANPGRSFVSGSFAPIPSSGTAVNYNNRRFTVTPQTRRTLDWSNPLTGPSPSGLGFLDDNMLFPDASGISMASPTGDIGDYTDLSNEISIVLRNVSDLSFVLVSHDGTETPLNDADASFADSNSGTGGWEVRQGVWLDGRMLTDRPDIGDPPLGLPDPPQYGDSPLPRRPVLIRVVMTLEDPRWAESTAPLSRTFTFSFALPGFLGTP